MTLLEEPRTPAPPKRRGQAFVRVLGIVLVLAGLAIGVSALLWPESTQHAGGAVVGAVRQQVQHIEQSKNDGIPTVTLGPEGGPSAIDTSPSGEFVEMASYRVQAGLQPVFAAHNGSGGDILLPWANGQEVDVVATDGTVTRMRVTDMRDTPQYGVTTADILGMAGSIVLQSCYWTSDEMKFVALTPLGEEPVVHNGVGDTNVDVESFG